MTLVCVPIMVESVEQALAEAALSAEHGADLVELRIDGFIHAGSDAKRADDLSHLVTDCALPTIVTCRHSSEGGESELDAAGVVALYSRLAGLPRPPRYVDIELARTAGHERALKAIASRDTGVIVSMHDFEGRPADLTRRLSQAYQADFATVVKVAYRARSLRDNLELFEILRDAPKPTIALGMGEFGLMSRVLAPKFGGLLTFAALRDSATTAPGQPTLEELFNLYRFRKIGQATKVYGVIGWPVTHSMSPLVHNAGFGAIGWDGVYLPMPVAADEKDDEASYASFKATFAALVNDDGVALSGASITLPHKQNAASLYERESVASDGQDRVLNLYLVEHSPSVAVIGAANTFARDIDCGGDPFSFFINTDVAAVELLGNDDTVWRDLSIRVVGAGGVSRAIVSWLLQRGSSVNLHNRSRDRAEDLVTTIAKADWESSGLSKPEGVITVHSLDDLPGTRCDIYINCTPVGMKDGPEPDGMSIPVHELAGKLPPETVFFDTVYNPIETPMLKAAKEHGFRTIDGVQMFVAQAELQFHMWTGQKPPEGLFDRLVREKLSAE